MFSRVLVLFLFCSMVAKFAVTATAIANDHGAEIDGLRIAREEADAHEDDGHGHEEEEEGHDHASENECVLDKRGLVKAFNEVAIELNLTTIDGTVCALPVLECHHHDDDEDDHHDDDDGHHDEKRDHEDGHHDDDDHHGDEDHGSGSGDEMISGSCQSVYDVCMELIIHTGLSPSSCFSGECLEEPTNTSDSSSSGPSSAQAYGLGFLMVVLVSLGSLLGVLVVPLLNAKDKNKNLTLVYKYVYVFMIALGTSALLCDAILHLFPHAWGLHVHEEEGEDGHDHDHEEEGHGHEVEEFIWKGTIALLAIYLFYLLEYILHGFANHTHSHGFPLVDDDEKKEAIELDVDVDGDGKIENGGGTNSKVDLFKPEIKNEKRGIIGWVRCVKPLAWLIVIGDGLHNFADGLALGAAISTSLTLGIGTTIALILHEIPHEFGDYVILLSTGLTWYSALIFNFMSALSAILGFFIGVAAGDEASPWILAFAAGLFIYIALVDLLPELIHPKEKGWHRFGLFLAANVGFFISFLALFLLAVYEEDIENL